MKTLMKTIGILSFLLVVFAVSSCEKNNDAIKPDKKEQLFALPTKIIAPDSTGTISDENIKKGVVIGTKAEMKAYIDRLMEAAKKAEGDTPPKLQKMKLSGPGSDIVFGPGEGDDIVDDVDIDAPCQAEYFELYSEEAAEIREIVNQTCVSQVVTFNCIFDRYNSYSFIIRPTNDCKKDHTDEFAYSELTLYPFDPGDRGPGVIKYIEELNEHL